MTASRACAPRDFRSSARAFIRSRWKTRIFTVRVRFASISYRAFSRRSCLANRHSLAFRRITDVPIDTPKTWTISGRLVQFYHRRLKSQREMFHCLRCTRSSQSNTSQSRYKIIFRAPCQLNQYRNVNYATNGKSNEYYYRYSKFVNNESLFRRKLRHWVDIVFFTNRPRLNGYSKILRY